MADVVYTINYDKVHGLSTSQGIEVIGTSRDRVRFVTETTDYKMALKRDETKNRSDWPLAGIPDPYPIPLKGATPANWLSVGHSGVSLEFHYICGYIDANGQFQKWSDSYSLPAERRSGAAVRRAPASSLPWPVS